jgi:hypothetical protein
MGTIQRAAGSDSGIPDLMKIWRIDEVRRETERRRR